jgi:hypothetical protein
VRSALWFGNMVSLSNFWFDESLLLSFCTCEKIMHHTQRGCVLASLRVVRDLAEVVALLFLSLCAAL